jgi:hypothetical protein
MCIYLLSCSIVLRSHVWMWQDPEGKCYTVIMSNSNQGKEEGIYYYRERLDLV